MIICIRVNDNYVSEVACIPNGKQQKQKDSIGNMIKWQHVNDLLTKSILFNVKMHIFGFNSLQIF